MSDKAGKYDVMIAAIKWIGMCTMSYFVVAFFTASNFDHTEFETGGGTAVLAAVVSAVATKKGWL